MFAIKSKPDQEEEIVKMEMAYYAHTHKAGKIARPHLFRLNAIPHSVKMENLTILLADEDISRCSVADLPSNEDVIAALTSSQNAERVNSTPSTPLRTINELCVVVWLNDKSSYEWFIGYVTAVQESTCAIDHLHRAEKTLDNQWKYPSKEDVQEAEEGQIVQCAVKGEWDIAPDKRKRIFILDNLKEILRAVNKHIS